MNHPYFHEKLYEMRKKELDKINTEGWKFVKPIDEKGALSRFISRLIGFVRSYKIPAAAKKSTSGNTYRELASNSPQRNGCNSPLCLQAVRVASRENACRKVSG